jgi:hypothetical protein
MNGRKRRESGRLETSYLPQAHPHEVDAEAIEGAPVTSISVNGADFT